MTEGIRKEIIHMENTLSDRQYERAPSSHILSTGRNPFSLEHPFPGPRQWPEVVQNNLQVLAMSPAAKINLARTRTQIEQNLIKSKVMPYFKSFMWDTSSVQSNAEDNIAGDYLWSSYYFFARFSPVSLCQVLSLSLSFPYQMSLFKYQVYLCMFFNRICSSESWIPCLTRSLLPRWSAINNEFFHNGCSAVQNPAGQSRFSAESGCLALYLSSLENLEHGDSTAWSENFCETCLLQAVYIGAVGNKTLALF